MKFVMRFVMIIVRGVVCNLYFMSREEMQKSCILIIIGMMFLFVICFELVLILLRECTDTELMFSIEGCDFLEVLIR